MSPERPAMSLIKALEASPDPILEVVKREGFTARQINRWRRELPWFTAKYEAAIEKRMFRDRVTIPEFDELFPGWKDHFLEEANTSPGPVTEVCERLAEKGLPVEPKHVYACQSPKSRFYDEDFSLELAALDAADLDAVKVQLFKDLKEGKSPAASIQLLKAHRMGPLEEKSSVEVTSTTTRVDRKELHATLVTESRQVGAGIKKRLEARNADNGSDSAEERSDSADNGGQPGSEGEDVVEGEVLSEEDGDQEAPGRVAAN